MARIRMVKPEFFDDPDIGDLTFPARLFFIGLWTQADRAGRLREDFRRLKARLFPFDDLPIQPLIDELVAKNMICRYRDSAGTNLIWVRNFSKHQRPHLKEQESVIEAYSKTTALVVVGTNQAIACPPDSGVLSLDSGVRSLEAGRVTPVVISSNGASAHKPKKSLSQEEINHNVRRGMSAAMRRPYQNAPTKKRAR